MNRVDIGMFLPKNYFSFSLLSLFALKGTKKSPKIGDLSVPSKTHIKNTPPWGY